VVAPVAAIVPLVSTGPGETSGCQALIAQAGGKPARPRLIAPSVLPNRSNGLACLWLSPASTTRSSS
jgi:hypothetical protein